MSVPETLILASGSPRRSEMLDRLAIEFTVRPADVDESVRHGEAPDEYVRRLAIDKALAELHPGEVVLAADTTVTIDGLILGKPNDRQDAKDMLQSLAGRRHEVLTGIAVSSLPTATTPDDTTKPQVDAHVARTQVRFANLDERTLRWYLSTGEGDDKAGAYAVQGQAALFIEALEGSYDNVVGLPLTQVEVLLRGQGRRLLDWVRSPPRDSDPARDAP